MIIAPPPPAELMVPIVYGESIDFTAGQSRTLECIFSVPDNLFRAPSVQWLNSTGHILSNTGNHTFSPLLTSDGGVYTCSVTISIPELNISLAGVGNTTVTVELKVSLTGANTTTVTIESK